MFTTKYYYKRAYSEDFKKIYGGKNPFNGWTRQEYLDLFYKYPRSCNKNFKLKSPDFQSNPVIIDKKFEFKQGIREEFVDEFTWSSGKKNYRKKSVTGSIGFQGMCGCCYAFATATVIQSIVVINDNYSSVEEISVQQIIDCTSSDDSTICDPDKPCKGCDGGSFDDIIATYFNIRREVLSEKKYPFILKEVDKSTYNFEEGNKRCDEADLSLSITIPKLQLIIIVEEKFVKQTIYNFGPVFCYFRGAGSEDFQLFNGNIYKGPKVFGDGTSLHAMVIVGWFKNFWYVKNSFGEYWGTDGFVLFPMNEGYLSNFRTATIPRPECGCDITIITNITDICYNYSTQAFMFKLLFKGYRTELKYNFYLQIYYTKDDNDGYIYPSAFSTGPGYWGNLLTPAGKVITDENFYFVENNGRLKKSDKNTGNYFYGQVYLFGVLKDLELPIYDENYIWYINFSIFNNNREKITTDTLEINFREYQRNEC